MATKENKDKRKRKATGKKKAKVSHIIKPDNLSMEEWQVKLRRQIAEPAKLKIRCVDDELCPGEYLVDNPLTANEYKVVYRGANSEWNYCSCWDFKTSRLGTCKHIEAVKKWLGTRKEYRVHREIPPYTSVYLSYREERCVKIRIGADNKEEYEKLAKDYFDEDSVLKESAFYTFGDFLNQAKRISDTFML